MSESRSLAVAPASQPRRKSGTWKGFSLWQLEQFGIKQDSDGSIWLPYYKRDRTLFRAKQFAPDGRSWWLGGLGKGQIPYGLEQLEHGGKALVLTEGESDTLALRLAWPGSIVAIGIPGASSWKSEWKQIANGFERVYVSFDADDAGDKLAAAVCADLPQAKRLSLPRGADTRAILQEPQLGKRAYRALIDAAEARVIFNRTFESERRVHDLYERSAA
jgi:5S rRNA maturation endonuclease (ribonuclease M5)